MKTRNLFEVFMRGKPAKLLLELLNNNGSTYASLVAKKIDCTYSHVIRILQELEDSELLGVKKTGRTKYLELTPKGEKLAKHVEGIKGLL